MRTNDDTVFLEDKETNVRIHVVIDLIRQACETLYYIQVSKVIVSVEVPLNNWSSETRLLTITSRRSVNLYL